MESKTPAKKRKSASSRTTKRKQKTTVDDKSSTPEEKLPDPTVPIELSGSKAPLSCESVSVEIYTDVYQSFL